MSYSSLTSQFKPASSSNYTKGRNGYKICKITPHQMAGKLTGAQCANIFANPARQASSNYGIGYDGGIVCYVEEENRSWCSANRINDFQAITIEVSNSANGTDKITEASWNALVNLCEDICRRYNFRLNYDGTPNGNLTRHNMFQNTNCIPIDTELLTENGWKKLKDIEIGEKVASADINNLNITFEEVYDKVPEKIQDTYTNNGLTATKDHRMVYFIESNKNNYRIDYYTNLLDKMCYIPLAGTNDFDGLNLTDDMIKFYIAVQADGYYIKEKDNYYGLEFHLKKERKVERIKEILENINLPYTISNKSDGSSSIKIWNFEECNIVKDICEKYLNNKCFTYKWINLNKKQAKLFLEEILKWDGCETANKYSSCNSINLDVVNAIASLNNVGSRVIGSDVFFRETPYITLNGETKRNKNKNSENTKVSCVSVKTGLILIRQNGKTFIVGNCPGAYLQSRLQELANLVNARLDGQPEPQPTSQEPDYTGKITYQVYTNKWLPEVSKCDDTAQGFAGIGKEKITAFRCKPTYGEIICQAHILGGDWLSEVNSKDYLSGNGNSYAGIYGKAIDAIRIKSTKGYVDYRVKTAKGWLPWVRQYNDYAGNIGQPILGIQMK